MLITDIRLGEPDILAGHEHDTLEVRALFGETVIFIPPTSAWTHKQLTDAVALYQPRIEELGAADFYLGTQFIGSTEV
jgi:hypothetical protein